MDLRINWRLAVFSIFFAGMFVYLSAWQFERADEKTAFIQMDKDRRDIAGVSLNQLSGTKTLDGLAIEIEGRFHTSKIFLLDNIVLNGVVGFEVLLPFEENEGRMVLVNRGFVPMGKTRADLPGIPDLNAEHQKIRGHLYVTRSRGPDNHFVSGEQSPFIVQSYDPSRFEPLLGYELLPQILRLGQDENDALPRHWPLVVMQPERHIGYAYTWLLMAITVVLAFGAFSYQTNRAQASREQTEGAPTKSVPTKRTQTNRVDENDI